MLPSDCPSIDPRCESLTPEEEVHQLSHALSCKFEELSLIHHLSDRLRLGEDLEGTCQSLLGDLEICLAASIVAMELHPDEEYEFSGKLYCSRASVDHAWLRRVADYTTEMARHARQDAGNEHRAAIWNHPSDLAPAPVRSVVIPIARQSKSLGRMVAMRPLDADEFGTVEADLMKSTSMMLGAHLINQRQYEQIQQMFEGTIQSLVSALDAKDAYTCGHSSRVAGLAVELARRLGFDDEGIHRIRIAGILHDIGKIGVEDSVLLKEGKLTEAEFERIKQHPVLGYEILRGIGPLRKVLPAVRHHHESWDGTGYPDGLVGNLIPRDAQVLAVADAFDAMTSDRPYRQGMPLAEVVQIFQRGRGKQWAADVVDALLSDPGMMESYAAHGNPSPATCSGRTSASSDAN